MLYEGKISLNMKNMMMGLNPYSNGICSMRLTYINILFTSILDSYDIECINIFLPKTGLF